MKKYFLFCYISCHISYVLTSADVVENSRPPTRDPSTLHKVNERYKLEIAAGDMADLFSTNIHKVVPVNFAEFSRRFVPVYPYVEKSEDQIDEEADERLDRAIREALSSSQLKKDVVPVLAPPDVVLAVAKQSLRQQSPPEDSAEFLAKDALRSGSYWNSYWIDEIDDIPVDDSKILRAQNNAVKSVRVKVVPGSKLYELISMTRDLSPRLLYVMNSKDD